MTVDEYQNIVLDECRDALKHVNPEETERFVRAVLKARKVFFVGVGRVMLSLQAICKRWAHLGIDTHYVGEITEPAITPTDLLIVGSGSGESLFPVAIARKAKSLDVTVAWIGSATDSTVARLSDIRVRIPVQTKLAGADELPSRQPMTSLFEQSLLLYGDSIACSIIERRGLNLADLWERHSNLE